MSQVCNKLAELNEAQLEAKGTFAKAGSTRVLAAMSDFYKAAELLETASKATGHEEVYIRSAGVKLEGSLAAFEKMRKILKGASHSEGANNWLCSLDFDRLYREGTRRGVIPTNGEQWSRLVQVNLSKGYLGVADALIDDVRNLQMEIESLIKCLGASEPKDWPAALIGMHTAFANYAAFAQMVAFVNALTPLDPTWSREALPAFPVIHADAALAPSTNS